MGLDYSVYLGPYLECSVTKVESSKKIITCSNTNCKEYKKQRFDKKTKFCESCGSKIQERDNVILVDSVDHWEIRESINERLCPPNGDHFHFRMQKENKHWFISNFTNAIGRKTHIDVRETENLFNFTSAEIANELDAFATFYAKEIAVIREKYGWDNVKLLWGFFNYIS